MKRHARTLGVLLAHLATSWSLPARGIGLEELLREVSASHPQAEIAQARVDAAEGELRSARGGFDLKAHARGQAAPVGYYRGLRGVVGLTQPTSIHGAELRAKYENGADFPAYYGDQTTSEWGQVTLSLFVPLLRDGSIDERRLTLARAELEREIAKQQMRGMRAGLLSEAAKSWWKWSIAGGKRNVYRTLLDLSEQRQQLLTEQVRTGQIAEIELTDNQRVLASRRASLMQADLELRLAALDLSMYHWKNGGPTVPAANEVPRELPGTTAPSDALFDALGRDAENAPHLAAQERAIEIAERELRLYQNKALPRLDLDLWLAQSGGPERPYSATEATLSETKAGAAVSFSWDVQRRAARGKAEATAARIRALRLKLQFELSAVRQEVAAARAALLARHDVARQNRVATIAAEAMAEAERERLALGQASILSINLREDAVQTARLAELEATLGYHLTWIDLQGLLGRLEPLAYISPDATAPAGATAPEAGPDLP